MSGTFGIVLFVLIILTVIVVHEAGHFTFAKLFRIKVEEFFVGFGPRLWSFRRGETEYGVKAILLGGYVRIIGMTNIEEVDPADEPRTFRAGSYKNRFIVVMAGVTVNVLLALVLFYAFFAARGTVYDGPSTTVDHVVHQVRMPNGDKVP